MAFGDERRCNSVTGSACNGSRVGMFLFETIVFESCLNPGQDETSDSHTMRKTDCT